MENSGTALFAEGASGYGVRVPRDLRAGQRSDIPGGIRMPEESTASSTSSETSSPAIDRKAIFGWAMFDFANSSFTTVMVTAYFSLYFQKVLVLPDPDGSTARGSY